VPSLDADEGSMQHILHALMELCTSLQRKQSQMADKIKDHDIEISGLKARVKSLKDKESRREEPIQEDAPITGGIIDIGEELRADKSTEKGSNDIEEMVNVLSSMEAANILSSGGTAFSTASVSPADVFLNCWENQRLSEQAARDSEIARIHAEEELKLMIEGLDRSNEVIAKHLSEYDQAEADLSVGEKIELIRIKLDQGSLKRVKISHISRSKPSQEQQFKGSKGVSEEELKGMMQLVPLEEVYIEALQEQIDAQVAREMEEEIARENPRLSEQIARDFEIERIHAEEELKIEGLDRSNEVIAKHLSEYKQAEADLSIGEKIELISELVKYQDHLAVIFMYQAQQSKPSSKKEQREFYMSVLESHAG
nr:hypothetical protein [Tanacetum cinerariifolium]